MKGNPLVYVPLRRSAEWVVAQFIYDIIRQSENRFSKQIMPERERRV
jgi:hypothetical protein